MQNDRITIRCIRSRGPRGFFCLHVYRRGPVNVDVIPLMNHPIPTKVDFSGCLDGKCAWRNFGGLTIEQATAKFNQSPGVHQEDFMYMHPVAFAYYFPVIDHFLRDTANLSEEERSWGRMSGSLAYCIESYFSEASRAVMANTISPAIALCDFMETNIELFIEDSDRPSDLLRRWRALRNHIIQFQTSPDVG